MGRPASASIPHGRCNIWLVDLDAGPAAVEACLARLPPDEAERSGGFLRPEDRAAFILCRAALRSRLARSLGIRSDAIEIRMGQGGKPCLVALPGLSFSISHTSGLGAIAISAQASVGIDVELHDRFEGRAGDVARHILTASEMLALAQAPQAARAEILVRSWTLKEAMLKAAGTGLTIAMSKLALPPPEFRLLDGAALPGPARGKTQHCWTWRWGRHAAALVALGPCEGALFRGVLRATDSPSAAGHVPLDEAGEQGGDPLPLFVNEEMASVELVQLRARA